MAFLAANFTAANLNGNAIVGFYGVLNVSHGCDMSASSFKKCDGSNLLT